MMSKGVSAKVNKVVIFESDFVVGGNCPQA